MNLADAIKKIKDTINAGVKPAENSFEDAVITVVENTGSGGSGLPEVTSEDNGDLLKVVDGEWDKADPDYKIENVIIVPSQENDIVWEEVTE